MSPRAIPAIKTLLRELNAVELRELAEGCLNLGTAAEVEGRLTTFLARREVTAAG
jgi:signal transduction protein with GAF and PtsI domain